MGSKWWVDSLTHTQWKSFLYISIVHKCINIRGPFVASILSSLPWCHFKQTVQGWVHTQPYILYARPNNAFQFPGLESLRVYSFHFLIAVIDLIEHGRGQRVKATRERRHRWNGRVATRGFWNRIERERKTWILCVWYRMRRRSRRGGRGAFGGTIWTATSLSHLPQ